MKHHEHLRNPMKKARALGAAHDGTHHFWLQRLTALALIPLGIWFVISILCIFLHKDDPTVYLGAWLLDQPYAAIPMLALLLAMFWHAKLGIQVIIEDYVHCHCGKTILLILNSFAYITAGIVSLLAILKLHFGL